MPNNQKSGCWLRSLLFALACFALAAYNISRWQNIALPAKVTVVLLLGLGLLFLIPTFFVLGFKFFRVWLKKRGGPMGQALASALDASDKQKELKQKLYGTMHQYRTATEDDFTGLDRNFYDQTQQDLAAAGFRQLGDKINTTLKDVGQFSPVIRVMVAAPEGQPGTTVVGLYDMSAWPAGKGKFKGVVELQSEFTDGTFLVTNNLGKEVGQVPPEIVRHFHPQDTTHRVLIDLHEQEKAALMAAKPDRHCLMIATLEEAIASDQRQFALKQKFQIQPPPRKNALAAMAQAQQQAAERKAKREAARGPDFLTGTGKPGPVLPLMIMPEEPADDLAANYDNLTMKEVIATAKAETAARDARRMQRLPIGASRLGGLPDLPPHESWPTHDGKKIPLLAQLDLAEFASDETAELLPAEGSLLVFGHIQKEPYPLVIRHITDPHAALLRAAQPAEDDIWPDWTDERVYHVVPVQSALHAASDRSHAKSDAKPRSAGHLLGIPAKIDGTAGDFAEYRNLSGDDWITLLTLHSVGSMQWSDAGLLYILIRRSHLQQRDFSRAFAVICSA